LVRRLTEGALEGEPRLWIAAPESGRVPFARGDVYRFQLFCCAGGERLLDRLVDRLRRLPAGLPADADRLALGANLRFRSATDFFTGERIKGVADLFAYGAAALAREVGFYQEQPPARVRLLSPARLLRPKDVRARHKGEGRYVHDRGELAGELLGQRLSDTLASLLDAVGTTVAPRSPLGLRVIHDDIGWYDMAYYDAEGAENPMGGVIGCLDLAVEDEAALPALVLGQYLGIGQRRTFGWGRYRLECADGKGTQPPRRPSRTLLSRAADPANLELAYRAIRANVPGRQAGRADAADDLEEDIAALAWVEHPQPVDAMLDRIGIALREASYAPATLRGFILRREGKSPRPLAVPPFTDRIAQRALMQVLQADCEPLLSSASYGYRRGLARQDARDRLQSLYRQGYQWLYEADIDDFFDSVSHRRLETRLRSLLPDEPGVDMLLAWIAAPVEYLGRRVERGAGLPQGAPVSPLLANLMLDDFDADLEHLGFRLVRFADDLVVACRSREEAEAAARRVRASLEEIDLRLNQDKSRIARFDEGFRFLGYTFLGDLAVDTPQQHHTRASGVLQLEDLPPASWLAQLARADPSVLADAPQTPGTAAREAGATDRRRLPAPTGCDEPCTLLVVTEGSLLSTTNGRLRVAMADGQVHEQHWTALGAVLASDLMEPFRHLVERQALAMCNRGELRAADFLVENGACRLDRRALRTYVAALSGRFLVSLEDAATGERGTA